MSDDQGQNEANESRGPRSADAKWPLAGGAFTALLAVGVMSLVGRVGDYQARRLLEATIPSIRFLSSSVMTASATVLALMLTMLALSAEMEADIRGVHYERIQQASIMAVVALITAIVVLMGLTFPLEDSEALNRFYNLIYYALLGSSALLGGMMVAVVLMLLNAIRDLVRLFHPTGSSSLRKGDTEE